MESINNNGISVCPKSEEMYTTFTAKLNGLKNAKYYQYDYRYADGELFSTVAPTLEKCREQKNEWLDKKFTNLFEKELMKSCSEMYNDVGWTTKHFPYNKLRRRF